jgi:hypothetical protein
LVVTGCGESDTTTTTDTTTPATDAPADGAATEEKPADPAP